MRGAVLFIVTLDPAYPPPEPRRLSKGEKRKPIRIHPSSATQTADLRKGGGHDNTIHTMLIRRYSECPLMMYLFQNLL